MTVPTSRLRQRCSTSASEGALGPQPLAQGDAAPAIAPVRGATAAQARQTRGGRRWLGLPASGTRRRLLRADTGRGLSAGAGRPEAPPRPAPGTKAPAGRTPARGRRACAPRPPGRPQAQWRRGRASFPGSQPVSRSRSSPPSRGGDTARGHGRLRHARQPRPQAAARQPAALRRAPAPAQAPCNPRVRSTVRGAAGRGRAGVAGPRVARPNPVTCEGYPAEGAKPGRLTPAAAAGADPPRALSREGRGRRHRGLVGGL